MGRRKCEKGSDKNTRKDLKTTTGLEETICLALARAISMSSLFLAELKSDPISPVF